MFQRLRDAGAVIVGVTNMHELGLGTTGHVSIYGPVGTPWNPAHCGGGSSGGSASAVGGRLVAGAVGTDGGGSIRFPAAYCGVTGLKFTWGRMPPDGYTHGSASLGAPGPICRDAADARLLGSEHAGADACGSAHGRPADRRSRRRSGRTSPRRWRSPAATPLGALGRGRADRPATITLPGAEFARIATVLTIGMETVAGGQARGDRSRSSRRLSPLGRGLSKYQLTGPGGRLRQVRVGALQAAPLARRGVRATST